MLNLRVLATALLTLVAVMAGCSSSNQAAIDSAVNATLAAVQTSTPTAASNPAQIPADSPPPASTISTPLSIIAPLLESPPQPISTVDSVLTSPSTPTSTATPVPTSIEELKLCALELINRDRVQHGVAPIAMGDNPAAQIHAEESTEFTTGGHWYQSGEKPYMVYSRTGGTSYVAENSAPGGWDLEEQQSCKLNPLRNCIVRSPKALVELQHEKMMYDDAHANWGHRDAILDPKHLKVNIGVAFTGAIAWWTGFYQHFEGGHFIATAPPSINGTELSFTIQNVTGVYEFHDGNIGVFYDPPPSTLTAEQREGLAGYCTGGGIKCDLSQDQRVVAWILEPLEPGYHYGDLESNRFVAHEWNQTPDVLDVVVNLENALEKQGVYTVMVWGTHKETGETTSLIGLSVSK